MSNFICIEKHVIYYQNWLLAGPPGLDLYGGRDHTVYNSPQFAYISPQTYAFTPAYTNSVPVRLTKKYKKYVNHGN